MLAVSVCHDLLLKMDNIIAKLAEKAVRCEKCKFAFSVAAFKEHTCFDKKKRIDEEAEHRYYVNGRIVTRKFFKDANKQTRSQFKFKCDDCEKWFGYKALDIHHCFKDLDTFRPNKDGKYNCDVCGYELRQTDVVRHYRNNHNR